MARKKVEDEEPEPKGIDWEAAERAAIEAEDDPGPEPVYPEPGTRVRPRDAQEEHGEAPEADEPTRASAPVAPVTRPVAPDSGGNAPRNTALTFKERLRNFGGTLTRVRDKMLAAIPKHVTPERLFQTAYLAIERNPKLLECTELSVIRCIVTSAQLGLDCSGIGGQAFLVPFKNNRAGGRLEAQLIIGYQGMMELARRSPAVAWIYANVVREKDPDFLFSVGPIPTIRHLPMQGQADPGPIVGAYAICIFTNPAIPPLPVMLTLRDIERAKSKSRARDDGPWVTDYDAMARKTAIKALCRLLPQNPELASALDAEDRAEAGEVMTPGEIVDDDLLEPPAANSGTAALKARMAKA